MLKLSELSAVVTLSKLDLGHVVFMSLCGVVSGAKFGRNNVGSLHVSIVMCIVSVSVEVECLGGRWFEPRSGLTSAFFKH